MIEIPIDFRPEWPRVASSRLFDLQSRPPREADGVVTAFRDGEVTLRSKRRSEGFTNAVLEIGYQGVRAGDLVVHSMDGFAGAIGVSDSDGKMSPVVQCYSPASEVCPRYYAYLLRELARAGFITSLAKGIRERSTAFDAATFRSIRIPKPPLADQNRIADFLDAETARIDCIVGLRRLQRSSLTEGLVLAVEDALGVREQSSSDVVPLRYVATVSGGLTLGKEYEGQLETRPYLRVANVQDGYLDLDDVTEIKVPADTARRFELRPGDVLMLEGNGSPENLGRGTIWRGELPGCLHQNHVHVVRAGRRLDPDYLDVIVRTRWARATFLGQSEHVGIATLSQEQIRSLPIPVPSLPDQRQLVVAAQRVSSGHASLLRAIDNQVQTLQERKQALITAAVTGQLDLARELAEEAS